MGADGPITQNALPISLALLVLGCLGLAMVHDKIPGISFKGLVHISAALVLLSGMLLMWKNEHQA